MSNVTITHTVFNGTEIKDRGINENAGAALLTDEEGKPLALIMKYHAESNGMFVGYKVLYAAITTALRAGAENLTIETDAGSLRKELKYGGSGNLYMTYKEYSAPFDVDVRDFDLSDDSMQQRAWLVYAAAGISLGLQESDRWTEFN